MTGGPHVSLNRLADLARAAGRSGEAEGLYRRSLQVREELTELVPGNTTYRRDVSVSYERLAELVRLEYPDQAQSFAARAVAMRRAAHNLDPQREDIAVELSYSLFLSGVIIESVEGAASNIGRAEILATLSPFESRDLLGDRGRALLRWARERE